MFDSDTDDNKNFQSTQGATDLQLTDSDSPPLIIAKSLCKLHFSSYNLVATQI